MVRTPAWILCAITIVASLVPGGASGQGPDGIEYELRLVCPGEDIYTTASCPVRAVDADDAMGDPSLAVDPFQPNNLILASLHGCGDAGGPTVKSRGCQVFTTFTSQNSGRSWQDNPYFPPAEVSNAFGEHTGITIDPYGHVYVGSLYAVPTGGGEQQQSGSFEYVIAAQKFSSLINIDEEQDGAYNAEYLDPVYLGNKISQMWFLFNPVKDHMTMVWTEQLQGGARAPDEGNQTGNQTGNQSGNQTLELPGPVSDLPEPVGPIVTDVAGQVPASTPTRESVGSLEETKTFSTLVQGSEAPPAASSSTTSASPSATSTSPMATSPPASKSTTTSSGSSSAPAQAPEDVEGFDHREPKSVIGIAWTNTSMSAGYHYQRLEWAIGPCSYSTNPVLSEGLLYVGCVADTEQGVFPWNEDARDGTVEMFRMDPDGGEPQYIGSSPIRGDHPKLGVRSDGRIALANAGTTDDGRLEFKAAYGTYKSDTGRIEWSETKNYASELDIDVSIRVVDAQIQDMIYREYSGAIHLILKLIVEPTGAGATTIQAVAGARIWKSVVAVEENYDGVLAHINLDVGNILNRTDPLLLRANEMIYNDLTDDFLVLPPEPHTFEGKPLGDLYQREFFAVGDYGTILFAEVKELTNLRGPGQAPAPPPPPPTPAPAAANAFAQALAPAAGLTVASLVAANFFVNKRKDVAVVRDSGKKRRQH